MLNVHSEYKAKYISMSIYPYFCRRPKFFLCKIFQEMLDFFMRYGEKAVGKARLELWDNPCPERAYDIKITFPEFTCLCPRSGYPDFATININYVPGRKIVEL